MRELSQNPDAIRKREYRKNNPKVKLTQRLWARTWRRNNSEKAIASNVKWRASEGGQSWASKDRKKRTEIQEKIRNEKIRRGCDVCGFKGHFAALDFHHRNPEEKRFGLGWGRNYSWESVLEEIQKCDVLCSNCHRILEHNKRELRVRAAA